MSEQKQKYEVHCVRCGVIGISDDFSSGANAACAHGNETGHTVISEPIKEDA